jgi:hypothetical protein
MEAGKNSVIYMGLFPGPNKADNICGKTTVTGMMQQGSTVFQFYLGFHPLLHCLPLILTVSHFFKLSPFAHILLSFRIEVEYLLYSVKSIITDYSSNPHKKATWVGVCMFEISTGGLPLPSPAALEILKSFIYLFIYIYIYLFIYLFIYLLLYFSTFLHK